MLKYIKNVSQLLLVLSGIHSLLFQYADDPRKYVSVLQYSWKENFNVVDD